MALLKELAGDLAFGIATLRAREAKKSADYKIAEQAELLDKATDAIIVRDLQHRVLFWNQGAERIFGWSAAEAIGKSSVEALHADPQTFFLAVHATLQAGGWTGELIKKGRDGTLVTLQSSWTLLRNGRSAPDSILYIETDITEQKKLEAQYLRAQRMESVGTLAGGIAHDLNNILAPIMISVELLRDDAKEERHRKLLDTVASYSQRGAEVVRQVLTFARGLDGRRVSVSLARLVLELRKVLLEVFPKTISFECLAAPGLWPVNGVPSQLHQVFMNLCLNARDAMPRGGTLTISLENVMLDDSSAAVIPEGRPGPFVLASVTDTGVGIPPDVLDRVFEPLFTTKEVGKGTGLGLATVVGIVKSHGGSVNVDSEQGKGSRFRVYLPADISGHSPDEPAVVQTALPRGEGQLILLVDDEPNIRNVAARALTRYGYSVMEAANGAEAVDLYARHQAAIALVLTDISMPIMDGATLIKALKQINPRVRIVASNGLPSQGSAARSMESGVCEFIPKPYTTENLLSAIQRELSNSEE